VRLSTGGALTLEDAMRGPCVLLVMTANAREREERGGERVYESRKPPHARPPSDSSSLERCTFFSSSGTSPRMARSLVIWRLTRSAGGASFWK